MTACGKCGQEILRARTPDGTRITLNAEETPGGQYAAWTTRVGAAWITHARPLDEDGHATAYSLHDCQAIGEQMRITA